MFAVEDTVLNEQRRVIETELTVSVSSTSATTRLTGFSLEMVVGQFDMVRTWKAGGRVEEAKASGLVDNLARRGSWEKARREERVR